MKKEYSLLLMYVTAIPLILSILAVILIINFPENILMLTLLILISGGGVVGFFTGKKRLNSDNSKRLIPLFFLPLCYTAIVWAVFMLISGGFYGSGAWLYYCIFHAAFAPIYLYSTLMGEVRLYLWAPLAYESAFFLGILLSILITRTKTSFQPKQFLSILTVFILAIGAGMAVHYQRSKTVLPSYGFQYGGGYSSTDLTPYEVTNPSNKLPKLNSAPALTIKDPNKMPILDGAEAAFPVYSAFANAVYENVAQVMGKKREVVSFTNTIYAYERLLSGDVDIYFGAEPSKEQRKMAEQEGKELVMTPIGKEAFVFFVNPSNSVNNLSVSDIKGIYSGKIKNWSDVGGKQQKIIAFQRPENSGSQTLLEKIMGDTPIMKPLKEDVPEGMGGIIQQVANYRNYENSIGFSFRFFATGMTPNSKIKLLSINGVDPSPANTSSGKYPFTASLYAITLKNNSKETIQPFLDWMKGAQGQEIIEKVGYIKMKE